ncbi:hypothetical protein V490_07250 [Pseudogymnoascus sp. VKM F-3557]|nr:hypothetical protein V490_07250 [Pseudogymnoascus sp. VKM F-3557]
MPPSSPVVAVDLGPIFRRLKAARQDLRILDLIYSSTQPLAKMKFTVIICILVAVATALPTAEPQSIEKRQGCSACVDGKKQCCSAPSCYIYNC